MYLKFQEGSSHVKCSYKKQQQQQRERRKLLEAMNMFITWIVVMITGVSTYVQADQIVYINYVQFCIYQLYCNKSWEEGRGRKE